MNASKKVLYVCLFPTALVNFYVHKCIFNKDKDATIITYKNALHNKDLNRIFSKVIYSNEVLECHFLDNESTIENDIKIFYDNLCEKNDISLDDYGDVYLMCDMTSDFAIYLSMYNKYYLYCEYAINQLNSSRYNLYDYHISTKNSHGSAAYFQVAKKHLSICGTSKLCKKIYLLPASMRTQLYFEKEEKIDFAYYLTQLTDTEKEILINCFDRFDIRKFCTEANGSTLLLTQRQWQYPVTVEETGLLYQYICDYFGNTTDNISIKPHPSDKYDHKSFFDKSIIFPAGFPADLFPIVKDFKISSAITVSSTSIQKFSHWCDDLIICGNTYFRNWRSINKIYFALKLVFDIGLGQSNIYRNHVPDGDDFLSLIRNHSLKCDMQESSWISLSGAFNGVAIVGDLVFDDNNLSRKQYYNMLLNLPEDSIIIYLDINKKYNFIDIKHYEMQEFIYTFKISKSLLNKHVYCNTNDEYLYVFCKNKSKLSKILQNKFTKRLHNVGVDICIQNVDSSLLRDHILYSALSDNVN